MCKIYSHCYFVQEKGEIMESGTQAKSYPSTAEVMKDRLQDACVAVAASEGIAGISIKKVADASGASRQTFYNHYKNKTELLADAFSREGTRIAMACAQETSKYPAIEDKFLHGLMFIFQNLPLNPLLRELVDNNKEFFSYVDPDSYSLKDFGELCLNEVFEEYPSLSADIKGLTEYWSRSVLSLLMLPSEDEMSVTDVEEYARLRLIPGLHLDAYEAQKKKL